MIRIGIVGAGTAGWVHSRHYRYLQGVDVVAICDPSKARRVDLGRKHKAAAHYADYREMLARESLDGISNCTPDALHAEVALAAIRRGLPVLSEKPMAVTLADARRMQAAAQRHGAIAMINFGYRHSGALARAARMIRDGKLGNIRHVEGSCLQSWLVSDYWGHWSEPGAVWKLSTKGGNRGALGDLGCHLLDFLTVLCGDIAKVDCRLKTFSKGVPGETMGGYALDANDSLAAMVEFASGAFGVLHASRWATGHTNSLKVTVYGDRGAVAIDAVDAPHVLRMVTGKRSIARAAWREVACRPEAMPFERFVRAIRSLRGGAPDFFDGLKNQAQLQACVLSAQHERPVRVIHPPRVGL